MASMLPIALTCLLFAFITTSFPEVVQAREHPDPVPVPPSALQTGVPYYVVPHNLIIKEVGPRRTIVCPYAIGAGQVPVTFSTLSGQSGHGVLGRDVLIKFNTTLPQNISTTWGYSSRDSSEQVPICLGCNIAESIVPAIFRIQIDGIVYSVRRGGESGEEIEIWNITSRLDAYSRGIILALSNEAQPATFSFYEADGYYDQGIKSVV